MSNYTILTKQLTACFLLVLFLFIHGIKLLHHHKGLSFDKVSESKKLIGKPSSDCSICDYHFIKDSHNATASIQMASPVILLPAYAIHLPESTTSIGLHSADRGPPSLL